MSLDFREQLSAPAPPSLVNAPEQYEQGNFSQNNRLIRTFFLKVFNALTNLLGPAGARYIDRPHGLFFSTTTQNLTTVNTAHAIKFPITYLSNGIFVNSDTDSRINVTYDGVYNFQFSGQLTSTNSSSKIVYVYVVRDGIDIGFSTHAYTVDGSGTQLEISWNLNIDLQAGSYLEFEWASSDLNVSLTATAPATPHVGIPSAVCAVSFIAPLPLILPTPP